MVKKIGESKEVCDMFFKYRNSLLLQCISRGYSRYAPRGTVQAHVDWDELHTKVTTYEKMEWKMKRLPNRILPVMAYQEEFKCLPSANGHETFMHEGIECARVPGALEWEETNEITKGVETRTTHSDSSRQLLGNENDVAFRQLGVGLMAAMGHAKGTRSLSMSRLLSAARSSASSGAVEGSAAGGALAPPSPVPDDGDDARPASASGRIMGFFQVMPPAPLQSVQEQLGRRAPLSAHRLG
jgi:hypothetical protein